MAVTTPKMLTVTVHGRLIGRPGRIGGLARFLDHALGRDRVWICQRRDIARHWIAHCPYEAGRAGTPLGSPPGM